MNLSKVEFLNALLDLAHDMGYRIENTVCGTDGARAWIHQGRRVLQIDVDAQIGVQLRAVASCLQNDPQLAWFELNRIQEASLRAGSEPLQSEPEIIAFPSRSAFEWGQPISNRKAA